MQASMSTQIEIENGQLVITYRCHSNTRSITNRITLTTYDIILKLKNDPYTNKQMKEMLGIKE